MLLDPGSWVLDLGSRILDPWILDPWIQDPEPRILDPGSAQSSILPVPGTSGTMSGNNIPQGNSPPSDRKFRGMNRMLPHGRCWIFCACISARDQFLPLHKRCWGSHVCIHPCSSVELPPSIAVCGGPPFSIHPVPWISPPPLKGGGGVAILLNPFPDMIWSPLPQSGGWVRLGAAGMRFLLSWYAGYMKTFAP